MLATSTPSLPTVVAVIVGWYLIMPLIIRSRLPRAKGWQMEPFDPDRHDTSPELAEFLTTNVARLTDAGFRQAADLVHPSSTTTRVALLTHPDGVVATVVVMSRPSGPGKRPLTVMMVEFTAVLPTGTVLDVNNSPSSPIFAARADHIVYRFPQVSDPVRLYHIYQVLLQRSFGSAMLTQPDLSDPVQYLKLATEREYRRQVDTGYYHFDERTNAFAMSLKGAYLTTWKLMFPFKSIRAALFARQSRAQLREIEMASGEFSSPTPAQRG